MVKHLQPKNFMKPIAHFEERYLLSDDGRVLSRRSNDFLTPILNPNGYLKVSLTNGNEPQQLMIHRLVALHYLPNPYQHPVVNHLNGVKTDNRASNLEWCSHQENAHHALETGLTSGFMSFDDREKYLYQILEGQQVNDLAAEIGRRPETMHKMLREAAKKLGIHDQWQAVMKENRRNAAIRNLEKINNSAY